MHLVPVGELKPRDFFLHRGGNVICMKLDDNYVTHRTHCGFASVQLTKHVEVQPLPDCDSFDWQPPREPTAMELAKEWLSELEKYQSVDRIMTGVVLHNMHEIIAAMEREAGK